MQSLKLIFISFLMLCSIHLYSMDFDRLYEQKGGNIKQVLINNQFVPYYHYIDNSKTTSSADSQDHQSRFYIKLNKNIKLNHVPKITKLKHINGASFEIEEHKLIDFLSKYFNGKEIEYIEKIPVKYTSDIKSKKLFDKTITKDEANFYAPNDPFFDKQWHLTNQSNNSDIGYLGYRKFLQESDIKLDKNNTEFVIGIIDIGIFYDYPDLKNRIYKNTREIPNNGRDDDGNGYIDDYMGVDVGHPECTLTSCADTYKSHHGTEMTSIIASATDNNVDIAGIAPRNVKLLPINSSKNRKNVDTFIEAYDYLLDMKSRGVNIIGFNISAGGPASRTEYEYMKAFEAADILVIASAGNDSMNIDPMNGYSMTTDRMGVYPAKYDTSNILSIGAYDKNGKVANFSNYGNKVHIFVPGVEIVSQPYPELDKLNLVSGTSPAAAIASGIVGVTKSLYPNCPNINIRNFIINSSKKIGEYKSYNIKTIKISDGILDNGKLKNLDCNPYYGIGRVF